MLSLNLELDTCKSLVPILTLEAVGVFHIFLLSFVTTVLLDK